MRYIYYGLPEDELYHHGIKDQKWGIRRFQNPDGSLTEEGRRRYGRMKSLANDAAVKAKAAVKRVASDYHERTQKKREAKAAEKAEKVANAVDMQNRLNDAEYKRREYLKKKNPKYLTNDELKELNYRKELEDKFEKNYQNAGKTVAKQFGEALFNEVAKPAAVAIGKAVVLDAFSKEDKFESIATEELRRAFGYNTQKKNGKDKNNNQGKNNGGNNNQGGGSGGGSGGKSGGGSGGSSKQQKQKQKGQSAWQKFMSPTPDNRLAK